MYGRVGVYTQFIVNRAKQFEAWLRQLSDRQIGILASAVFKISWQSYALCTLVGFLYTAGRIFRLKRSDFLT